MATSEVRQANFVLPVDLIEDLRRTVPRGEQSRVVAEALRKELKRLRFQRAIKNAFGAWSHEPHPELGAGVDQYLRQVRRSSRGEGAAGE